MWRLKRIIAQNLCAFRELDYHLSQGVTTLVFGDNRDNESQRSNGSGKSALLEVIALGITGSPMRKIRTEEIIRDDAEECWVCLVLDNDASDEVFTIERQIFRKGASVVTCHIERSGSLVETDEAVQPSVDAYNKYILYKLGISREELYNNFLLSKYKYSDFLSSSDKDKKEIINHFCNGNLVDQAIAQLLEDCDPVQEEVRQAELELAGIDGRIEMLQEQLSTEESNRGERVRRKEEQIAEIEGRIASKRMYIRESQEQIAIERVAIEKLTEADTALQLLENGDDSLEKSLAYITTDVMPLLPGNLTNWQEILEGKKQQLRDAETQLQVCDREIKQTEQAVRLVQERYNKLVAEYRGFEIKIQEQQKVYDQELSKLEEELTAVSKRLGEMKQERRKLISEIESLRNKLAGSITCPACGHEFLTADHEFDIESGRKILIHSEKQKNDLSEEIIQGDKALGEIEASEEGVRKDKRLLKTRLGEWSEQLSQADKELQNAGREQESIQRKRQRILDLITSLQEDTSGLRRRLFDEVFGLLDEAYKKQERSLKVLEEDIHSSEKAISTMQDTIEELRQVSAEKVTENLHTSLKTYRAKGNEVLERKTEAEGRLRILQEQEQRFVQFKTYLANSKIEALAQVTNGFLENIGSDIRIRFSGYTVLKTGKVREKISITLLRDGIDCGSFGKFSAGEAARVNLATILAMQKLINGNCEGDKGLDLLVLDEIMEAVDEDGLSSMFAALNSLGITALVVSHGNVAEGYPHKLVITKEHGESKID